MATATYYPSGEGTVQQLTKSPNSGTHWEKVITNLDGKTVTLPPISGYGEDVNVPDFFTYTPSVLGGTITKVEVFAFCASSSNQPTYCNTRMCLYIGGTAYYGDSTNITSTGTWYSHAWTTSPATSSVWDWTEVYSLEFGVSFHWHYAQAWTMACDQVYLKITYTPPTVVGGAGCVSDGGIF